MGRKPLTGLMAPCGQAVFSSSAAVTIVLAAMSGAVAAQSSSHSGRDYRSADPGPESQGHRTVAGILCLMLLAGFARVYRVLWQAPHGAQMARQMAPLGTMPVECGTCRSVQYVPGHGHAFLCFRCHSVNWLPGASEGLGMMTSQTHMPQMPSLAVGPLRHFSFLRRSETLFEQASNDDNDDPRSVVNGDAESPAVIGSAAPSDLMTPRTREQRLPACQICMDAPGDAVLMPCAHGGICKACATKIVQNDSTGGSVCPHCRSDITMVVKIDDVDGENVRGTELRIPIARPMNQGPNPGLFPWRQDSDRLGFAFFERRLRVAV